jgi:tetratricopeptide (TPR) repeat protein
MLAIAARSFEEKIAWNSTALQYAEASTDERARGWCGSLYNNLGWTYHDQGDYERALECFQKALQFLPKNRPIFSAMNKIPPQHDSTPGVFV